MVKMSVYGEILFFVIGIRLFWCGKVEKINAKK